MKSTERRHLKENELKVLARQARGLYDNRRRQVTWLVGLVVVVGLATIVYVGWRQNSESDAAGLLAQAMSVQLARIGPPPAPGSVSTAPYFPTERERAQAALTKFKAAADAYPETDAGVFARYQEASLHVTLGNAAEGAKAYQAVIDRAGNDIYGQMARLGLAEAQLRSGQYDQAINAFKELAQRKDGPLPVDGVLMQLGYAYLDAGKPSDAQQTFNRLLEEFPESPFNADAKKELDNLKKT